MKALLIDSICPDLQELKQRDPSVGITGAGIHDFEAVRAVFEYGTWDRYFFLQRDRFGVTTVLPEWCRDRAEVVHPSSLGRLRSIERMPMMTTRTLINTLVPVRTLVGASWPAVGFIHSLSGPATPYLMLSMLVSGLNRGDALFCSTRSGRTVVERLYALLAENNPGLPQEIPIQLPVVPLGVDCHRVPQGSREEARRRLGLDEHANVLLYFGRFTPMNKCDLPPLLLAFAREFGRDGGKTILVLAGDDTQRRIAQALSELAVSMGVGHAVVVRPNCTAAERSDLFASADIFVSPSDNVQETFGLTIAEAMSAGLPVVASDWNGYKELVAHGTTGFLVPVYWPAFGPEFDIVGLNASIGFDCRNALLASATVVDCDAMMNACRLLIDKPGLRRAFGEAGRCRALQEFDYRVVVRRWEETMDDLITTAGGLAGTGRARPDPLAYNAQRVFQHYPTRMLDDGDVIRLTAFGKCWLAGDVPGDPVKPIAAPYFDLALEPAAQVVQQRGGAMAVGELVAALRQSDQTDMVARAAVGRLQKYGIFAIEAPGASRDPGATAQALSVAASTAEA